MTTVFIAEKPSMGKAIAARLKPVKTGAGFIECAGGVFVTWCFGHLFESAPPEYYNEDYKKWTLESLPMVPDKWKLLPKNDCKVQLRVIKDLLAKATTVVNAGDADAEGELLVYECIEEYKFKGPVKRLWLSALDDASIDKALGSLRPGAATYPLKLSAESRSRVDWLIGMNLTRAGTLETLKGRGFLDTKGKQLISTEKARALIAALPAVLTQPDLTAIFEQKLEEIRTSGGSPDDFLAKQVAFVTKLVNEAKGSTLSIAVAHECPLCSKALVRKAKTAGGFFWGCVEYRATGCRGSADDNKGKPDFSSKTGPRPVVKPAAGAKPPYKPSYKK